MWRAGLRWAGVVTAGSPRNEELRTGVTGEDTDIIMIIMSPSLGVLTPLTSTAANKHQAIQQHSQSNIQSILPLNQDSLS